MRDNELVQFIGKTQNKKRKRLIFDINKLLQEDTLKLQYFHMLYDK